MKVIIYIFSCIGFLVTLFFYSPHLTINWQWGWLGLYIIVHLMSVSKLLKSNDSFSKGRAGFSTVLALGWLYSSHRWAFSSLTIGMWLATLLTLCLFSLTLYSFLFWLEQPFNEQKKPGWGLGILYGLIPGMVWFIYFLVYAPGKMTFDSFWQWAMAHHVMPYNAWHPVLHTWMIQATTWIYDSPATYTLVQILLVATIVGYALYNLQSFGVPFGWVLALDLFYALDPVNGFYVITMWKDIPFAAFILLLTTVLAKIFFTDGEWLKGPTHITGLILIALITMLLRDNGNAVVLATLVLFIVLIKRTRLRMIGVTLPVVILYLLFHGPLMSAFHVIKNPLNQALAVPSQQIAATYKNHGRFTPQLKAYFNQILPEKRWIKDYNPYTVNPIKHDDTYRPTVINNSFSTYLTNWAKLLALNPTTFVRAYLKEVAAVWQFQTPKDMHPYFTTGLSLQKYPVGMALNAPAVALNKPRPQMLNAAYKHYVEQTRLASPKLPIMPFRTYQKAAEKTIRPLKSRSLLPGFKSFFEAIFHGVDTKLENYFLKGAIPLFLLLLGCLAAVKKRGMSVLGIYLPVFFVIITIVMAMPAPDFRYAFSFVFTVPFLLWFGKLKTKVD